MGKEWDAFGGRSNASADKDRASAKTESRDPRFHQTVSPFPHSGSALPCAGQRDRFIAFLSSVMAECLRVLTPGAYGLVWALPRTSHWTATALEDAGFEIRDRISHLFGQGFPKGKGCLKPAVEDWWLVRKPGPRVLPLPGLDGCRIGTEVETWPVSRGYSRHDTGSPIKETQPTGEAPAGRWPANLVLSHHPECVCVGTKRVKGSNGVRGASTQIYGGGKGFTQATGEEVGYADATGMEEVEEWRCVDDCPVRILDEQSGVSKSNAGARGGTCPGPMGWGQPRSDGHVIKGHTDSGGASRFFYVPKASRRDRGAGNNHPTVKPHNLMRWLCRLITPPGGLILDPFAGSCSTPVAAIAEGFGCIAVEKEAEYVAIGQRRIAEAQAAMPLFASLAVQEDNAKCPSHPPSR